MTVAYDGQSNRLGSGLFVASLMLLVVGLGPACDWCSAAMPRFPQPARWHASRAPSFSLHARPLPALPSRRRIA